MRVKVRRAMRLEVVVVVGLTMMEMRRGGEVEQGRVG